MTIGVLVKTRQQVSVFGCYLAEILRCEGFADHDVVDVDTLTPDRFSAVLTGYDAVIVTRMNLDPDHERTRHITVRVASARERG